MTVDSTILLCLNLENLSFYLLLSLNFESGFVFKNTVSILLILISDVIFMVNRKVILILLLWLAKFNFENCYY